MSKSTDQWKLAKHIVDNMESTRYLKKENEWICTILAFALIPISGFAIDVYIPSFPEMVNDLHTSPANVKLTMTIYLISYGLSQLLMGSLIDSYGRYRINLISLATFSLSCIAVGLTSNIPLILLLRFIQGISISLVMLSRRAFIIDVYSGEKRKHYTSLLTVVWSTAPIVAPFAGGFLQASFGWRSNFYFLAAYGFIMLILELIYGGETIKERMRFHYQSIWQAYKTMLTANDFSLGLVVLGFSYSMVMAFGMSIPFIVEHTFNASPIVSGNCALFSGAAIFAGGLIGKRLINKPLYTKLVTANTIQLVLAIAMYIVGGLYFTLLSMMLFVVAIHLFQGFTYNGYFTYCVTRFPQYAATASGVASGGSYLVFSAASFIVTSSINIVDQKTLSISYIIFIVLVSAFLWLVRSALRKKNQADIKFAEVALAEQV
ncbi:MFS transporter [Pedobacter aquatilis]|uniref:MFS transporter n=1 Tax=Pedobacter aquatilis TaxID=351343 RepID=UPI0029301E7A|nr:MFS transporter [Pedobacter aquatilis]